MIYDQFLSVHPNSTAGFSKTAKQWESFNTLRKLVPIKDDQKKICFDWCVCVREIVLHSSSIELNVKFYFKCQLQFT